MSDAAEQLDDLEDGATFDSEETQEVEAVEETSEETEEAEEGKEEAKKKVEFTPEQQEVFNAEIGKKVAKYYEAEKARQAAEERLKQLEAKFQTTTRPEVPPPPNPYDPNYDKLLSDRDKAIAEQIRYDQEQRARTDEMIRQSQEVERQQAIALQQRVESYSQRAQKNGIKPETLQQAGAVVANFIQNPELVNHILDDEDGPSITVHLAKNPLEAQKIAQMSPTRAAIYIEQQIKGKITKKSPPPPPPKIMKGRGAPEGEEGPPGATFE